MAHGVSLPSAGRAAPRGSKRLLSLRGDDHLVERLRLGDEVAFEVMYERHLPGVLSFCRHMLGSREEAEDAVQQAFTAAHRDLLRDQRDIRLKPWLYAIARNRCVSMLRARREQAEEPVEASTEGLDHEVERRADLRQLVADLQDLPENQRAALVLSELRDLSHAEVAGVLDCSAANVKGLVFRARSGLGERREAREAACLDIRQELANAEGGTLRRGRLRHHLRACAPCSAYLEQVRHQRKMIAAVLPVVPTAGLKSGVLAAVGIGGGGGGGAAAGGGLLAALAPAGGASVAKVAILGAVVVGGGGLVGEAAFNGKSSLPGSAPAVAPGGPAAVPGDWPLGALDPAGAAEQKQPRAGDPAATPVGRATPKQDSSGSEQPRHGSGQGPAAPAPGKTGRPPHGGGSGGGRRAKGKAPKVPNVPRRTRARPQSITPGNAKPKPTPPAKLEVKPLPQSGPPPGKGPAAKVDRAAPRGNPPVCPGASPCP